MRRLVVDVDFSQSEILHYRETFEQTFYPVFYCKDRAKSVSLWYGDKDVQHSEFLDITIDKANRTVCIERDLKSSLIVWYYFHQQRLIISSDYNYFAQQLDLLHSIDETMLKLSIGNGKTVNWSIGRHIAPLYPRHQYHFSSAWLEIKEVKYEAKPIHINDILYQNFCNLNANNVVGAEISWGKDSAFLPILSRKSHFFPFTLVTGQRHTGETGERQRKTISWIIDFLGIDYEYHTITDADYPLKNEVIWQIKHPTEEIYKNSLLGEIAILKKHGINTIFTWFAWDEAFEDKDDPRTQFVPVPDSILRDVFSQELIDDVKELNNQAKYLYLDSVFQDSVYDALISRNNLYIQNGIWPMTPYLNRDIYAYFLSLNVSKKEFFASFYANFDAKLRWLFDHNTNMGDYFFSYFQSNYFNNLLQSCFHHNTTLHRYYNIEQIKKKFSDTSTISRETCVQYGFWIYKFVKMSLMLKYAKI